MSLIKLNNNGVKNITSVGSVGTGDLVFISKQTASSSASISFTSGIDSTYKEYVFYFNNIHSGTDEVVLTMNGSTDSGSNYNVTKTTTYFEAYHREDDGGTPGLAYSTSRDMAQGTGFCDLQSEYGTDNDQAGCGYLHLFNPSSTTFVKHFMFTGQQAHQADQSQNNYVAGYFNTTSAIDAVQFKMSSGNIDAGDILLYGLN
jgi:hypothetical protein